MKKNALTAALELLGSDGESRRVGTVDFHVLHRPSGFLSGAILSPEGTVLGQVSIKGVDIDALGSKAVGRPPEKEKRLAVFLAWALKCAELGGKRTLADEETAKVFDYSDGKKVRDIRVKMAEELGIAVDRDIAIVSASGGDGSLRGAVLIERPSFYQTECGAEICGVGSLWTPAYRNRVASSMCLKVEVPHLENAAEFAAMKKRGGPVIISVF